MLHILLTILKVTGIITAAVIAIALLIVMLILFVPVRYKAKGRYEDGFEAGFCVSWLFHFATIRGRSAGGASKYEFKILWFKLRKKENKERARKKRRRKSFDEERNIGGNEDISETNELPQRGRTADSVSTGRDSAGSGDTDRGSAGSDNVEQGDNEPGSAEHDGNVVKNNEKYDKKYKKKNVFSKICGKIKNIIHGTLKKFREIIGKLSHIRDKTEEIREFVNRGDVKEELKVIKKETIKLVRHIFPTRLAINARIGFGEPDITGIILGFMYALCAMTGKCINITPDFEEKRVEADFNLRGRIRIFTVLVILLKIYLQKNVVTYIKNFKL